MRYILLAPLFLSLALSSCGEKENSESEQGLEEHIRNLDNSTTSIEFESKVFDFGTIQQGDPVEHVFKFRNTGDVVLVISKVKPDCGCTAPRTYDRTVQPGEEGEISVVFDSKRQKGRITKHVHVSANTDPKSTVLTIRGEVLY